MTFLSAVIRCAPYAILIAGCATAAPRVEKEELAAAQEFYEVKSRRYSYAQVVRVRTVGERLLQAVPPERHVRSPKPSIGIILDTLTPISAQVFGIDAGGQKEKACLIVGILPGSPAEEAGLEAGDILLQVKEAPTPSLRKAAQALGRLKPGEKIRLLVERDGRLVETTLEVKARPYPVAFAMVDDPEVNAFAVPSQIVVTTGLLRFIHSDDELAVVLAHELAHLTEGHYTRGMGTGIITGTIGGIAGMAVDVVFPGAGKVISGGLRAPFSKDLEREADVVGLRYADEAGFQPEAALIFWDRFATELPQSISRSFFSTHPTSPERLLLIEKAIDQLRGSKPKRD